MTQDPHFTLPSMPPSYPGGKGAERTIRVIINEIPPHERYIEPFVGGGAVVRTKRPATINEVWERDELIAEIWRNESPAWIKTRCIDSLKRLKKEPFTANDFLFIDPPYLSDTIERDYYAHTLSYDQHIDLLQTLKTCEAMVMICALPNVVYDHHLSNWRTIQYENVGRNGKQWEQIWMNYAKPTELHDHRFIGKNHRERELIRDRLQNMIAKIEAMPILERSALMERLRAASLLPE
jgi:DNA adenine methylase